MELETQGQHTGRGEARVDGSHAVVGTRQRLIDRLKRQAVARLAGQVYEDALLTTGEVAALFRVSHRAVRSWADCGKIQYIRTMGGHRRFVGSGIWEIFQNALPEDQRLPAAGSHKIAATG